ncbi:hypothetical protein T265_00524 [Opisthorchis viverrini]|uniref:Uncharacterized protein n=1 Tax=Opisthorchis viverrini TaxID=6198 RepID=A0A075AJM3_OPIVI|nr:hypothetical protein T265_00524 [Opisthorchis viverrini]KER33634.1 hypothetical protein T265_00524 [Opisthorchis viverrini]
MVCAEKQRFEVGGVNENLLLPSQIEFIEDGDKGKLEGEHSLSGLSRRANVTQIERKLCESIAITRANQSTKLRSMTEARTVEFCYTTGQRITKTQTDNQCDY